MIKNNLDPTSSLFWIVMLSLLFLFVGCQQAKPKDADKEKPADITNLDSIQYRDGQFAMLMNGGTTGLKDSGELVSKWDPRFPSRGIPPEFYLKSHNAYYWPRFDPALSQEQVQIAERLVASGFTSVEHLLYFLKKNRSFKGDISDIKKEKISIKLSGYQNPIVNINGVEVAVNAESKTEVEAIVLPSIFSYHIRGDVKTASTNKKVTSNITFKNNTLKDSLLITTNLKTPVLAKAIRLPVQTPTTKVHSAPKKSISDE